MAPPLDAVSPTRFNQLAMRLNLPLFWRGDANANGAPDADEIRELLFYPATGTEWSRNGTFSPEFMEAVASIRHEDLNVGTTDRRHELLQRELDGGVPVLVDTDTGHLADPDRAFLAHMLAVAGWIDLLYARQLGLDPLAARLDASDAASRSLFRRNWGPWCLTLGTRGEAECSALDGARGGTVLDVYPTAMQGRDSVGGLCQALAADRAATSLLDPYTVVREGDRGLLAVPYTIAYADLTRELQAELRAAAEAARRAGAGAAFIEELRRVVSWFDAGRAPVARTAADAASGWFVELGATGADWDWCDRKAAFRMTLGRLVRERPAWLDGLVAARADLAEIMGVETGSLAERVGEQLTLLDVVFQAGASRWALGTRVGETQGDHQYVFANLGDDTESDARRASEMSSLFDAAATRALASADHTRTVSTVLHEVGHGLVRTRRSDSDRTSSAFHELQADAIALVLVDWLGAHGHLSPAAVNSLHAQQLRWAAYNAARPPGSAATAYQAAAALELGLLVETGALRWDASTTSADGASSGAFHVDFAAMAAADREVLRRASSLLAEGSGASRASLVELYVDGDALPLLEIDTRLARFAEPSYVYSVH